MVRVIFIFSLLCQTISIEFITNTCNILSQFFTVKFFISKCIVHLPPKIYLQSVQYLYFSSDLEEDAGSTNNNHGVHLIFQMHEEVRNHTGNQILTKMRTQCYYETNVNEK